MIDDKIVYWLENGRGNKYHLYKDCYYMGNCRPDARSGSIAEAKAAGRAEACKVCEERAARQVERGEDKPANRVYWRYGSDETVWHLYADCPMLRAAKEQGLLCSGTVEAAINTGRQSVCPMCKRRYAGDWEKTLQEIRQMDAEWDGTTVYWRTDLGSDVKIHSTAQCRELKYANGIHRGTVAEGRDAGHWEKCPVCWTEKVGKQQPKSIHLNESTKPKKSGKVDIQSVKLTQLKGTGAAAASVKKSLPTITKGQAWAIAIAVALCAWLACFFYYSGVCADIEDSAYSQGYDTGYDEASDLFDTYYKKGYNTGYADGRVAKQNSYAVYITKSGSKYHADGCSYLRGSKIAVDVNEAIKSGYTACSRCNP